MKMVNTIINTEKYLPSKPNKWKQKGEVKSYNQEVNDLQLLLPTPIFIGEIKTSEQEKEARVILMEYSSTSTIVMNLHSLICIRLLSLNS